MSRLFKSFLIVLPFLLGTAVAQAADWSIDGSNTLRGSVYDASGAGSGSPYPFEGDMYFDEISIFFDKRESPYSSWEGEFTGLYNVNDDYRSGDFGMVPERMNLTRENGEGALPYRAEVGDFFAYYSFMTMQRSLKGVQLEFQPFGSDTRQHSFIVTSGANESNWRDLTFQDDYFNGASWLMQDSRLGSWSINFSHNFRDNSFKAGTLDRNQFVTSISGELPFQLGSHNINIESEIAHFNGDHDGLAGAASGQERADNGYLVEMRGNHSSMPWDYRFRFEHYGQDFRPRGAVVSPDRRSFELHSGWRFQSGLRLRARAQLFQDSYETNNRLRTRTYGINLTGPFMQRFYPGLSGRLDAYIQNRDNALTTVSTINHTVRLNLNAPLPNEWNGRVGLFVQNLRNRLGRSGDILTRELILGLDRRIRFNGWDAFISPGFAYRTNRKGNSDNNEVRPAFSMRMQRDAHSMNMSYGSRVQDRRTAFNGIDVTTHNFNLDYRYQFRQHLVGLEANVQGRDPQPGDSTEAWRISAFWTMEFDRPARAPATFQRNAQIDSTATATRDSRLPVIDIASLGPRRAADSVLAALENAGLSNASRQAGYMVYEHSIYPDVFRRQRLALEFTAGVLQESGIIIDFDNVGDRDSNAQTYERIRQLLIRSLGNPTRTFEEGDFTARLADDVNGERFIRITEWKTDDGTVRFGIPRRLDGQVRMEIQHGTTFGPPRDTLWSIEQVR